MIDRPPLKAGVSRIERMSTKPPLFPERQRTDDAPGRHGEQTFAFLERSGLIRAQRVRELLNNWYSRYPAEVQSELASRFVDDFHAGFLELFLHETFLRLGWSLTPHPTVPGSAKRPDFLVEKGDVRFYLEAKVARDKSAEEEAREHMEHAIYDAINEVPSPNYFLRIKRLDLTGTAQPSLNDLKNFVAQQLTLHATHPAVLGEPVPLQLDGVATIEYREPRVEIDIALIPRSPNARGRTDIRSIGMYPFQRRIGGTKDAVRVAMKRKGARYGALDLPYIVAINCVSEWGVDQDDILDALFGDEQLVVARETGMAIPSRARNGAWIGPTGPVLTRVSGAIVASIYPWSLEVPTCALVHNPWARLPLQTIEHPFVSAKVSGTRVIWEDGGDLLQFFDLQSPWPGTG